MVKVNSWQDPQLTEAVLVWTGYGESTAPRRDNLAVEQRFGADAARLITLIEAMVDDFYQSKANFEAVDMREMWSMAIADFKIKHPETPQEITEALAWCYTFDYR